MYSKKLAVQVCKGSCLSFLLYVVLLEIWGRTKTKTMNNSSESLKHAIETYLERGFGSMNKNDFEVFIFNHLLNTDFKDKSDNAISRELRIPESKVKRLRYEAALKYQPYDEKDYKQRFYSILENCSFKKTDSKKIQFSIKDKSLRLFLEDMLYTLGTFPDSSFNSDIVTLTANDFILLLANFEGKKELVDTIKQSLDKNEQELPQNFGDVAKKGVKALINDIGGRFAPEMTKFAIEQFEQFIKQNISK